MNIEREKIDLQIAPLTYSTGERGTEVMFTTRGGGITFYFTIPLEQALEVRKALESAILETSKRNEEGKKPCE